MLRFYRHALFAFSCLVFAVNLSFAQEDPGLDGGLRAAGFDDDRVDGSGDSFDRRSGPGLGVGGFR